MVGCWPDKGSTADRPGSHRPLPPRLAVPDATAGTVGMIQLHNLTMPAGDHHKVTRFDLRIGQINIIPGPIKHIVRIGIKLISDRCKCIALLATGNRPRP